VCMYVYPCCGKRRANACNNKTRLIRPKPIPFLQQHPYHKELSKASKRVYTYITNIRMRELIGKENILSQAYYKRNKRESNHYRFVLSDEKKCYNQDIQRKLRSQRPKRAIHSRHKIIFKHAWYIPLDWKQQQIPPYKTIGLFLSPITPITCIEERTCCYYTNQTYRQSRKNPQTSFSKIGEYILTCHEAIQDEIPAYCKEPT
ncbi:MAG: hypothetical protein U0L62_02930, partial [Paludibacteraceae bacterium]|nr:hypothetical protein [Paludibacteraceae bacterium]